MQLLSTIEKSVVSNIALVAERGVVLSCRCAVCLPVVHRDFGSVVPRMMSPAFLSPGSAHFRRGKCGGDRQRKGGKGRKKGKERFQFPFKARLHRYWCI